MDNQYTSQNPKWQRAKLFFIKQNRFPIFVSTKGYFSLALRTLELGSNRYYFKQFIVNLRMQVPFTRIRSDKAIMCNLKDDTSLSWPTLPSLFSIQLLGLCRRVVQTPFAAFPPLVKIPIILLGVCVRLSGVAFFLIPFQLRRLDYTIKVISLM